MSEIHSTALEGVAVGVQEAKADELPPSTPLLRLWETANNLVQFIFVNEYVISLNAPETWSALSRRAPAPFWHFLPPHVKESFSYNSSGFTFDYHPRAAKSLDEITSFAALKEYGECLVALLSRGGEGVAQHTVLVGHGYGGLICEQTIVLMNSKAKDSPARSAGTQIRGLVTFGTPHFHAGVAQWALLSAKMLGIPCQKTAKKQVWSKSSSDDFAKITTMQTEFCNVFTQFEQGNRTMCCFSSLPHQTSQPDISPEWCILPRVRPVEIPSDHFDLTTFEPQYIMKRLDTGLDTDLDTDLYTVLALMSRWREQLVEGKIHYDHPFDPAKLKQFAKSSQNSEPASEWDPKSSSCYFIINPEFNNTGKDVALGNFVAIPEKPFQPIATKSDVLSTSDDAADYSVSRRITNGFEPWKDLLSAVFKHDKFESIIREEWSRDCAFKYLRAASPVDALKKHMTDTNNSFYLVTGILLGVTAGEKSLRVIGYKFLRVTPCKSAAAYPSSGDAKDSTPVIKVEQVLPLSVTIGDSSKKAEKPLGESVDNPSHQVASKPPEHIGWRRRLSLSHLVERVKMIGNRLGPGVDVA